MSVFARETGLVHKQGDQAKDFLDRMNKIHKIRSSDEESMRSYTK